MNAGKNDDETRRQMSLHSTWRDLRLEKAPEGTAASPVVSPAVSFAGAADAILHSPRLDALLACDAHLLQYNPTSFFIVFRARGRNVEMIAGPLLCLLTWDVAWILLFEHVPGLDSVRDEIVSLDSLIAPLLTPVSFLLVFRLGRAAVRFWDARSASGKLVETCREMISTGAVWCAAHRRWDLLDEFARWLAVFPVATKNFLRPLKRPGWEDSELANKRRFEIGDVLREDDAKEVLSADYAPIFVLNRLRRLVHEIAFGAGISHKEGATLSMEGMMLYKHLNENVDVLTGSWGAMERINATPLPFVYVVHLRTFLFLYLFLWHLEAVASNGWIALLPLFAASWALLGIEAAAVSCERPFRWNSNHLPLGKMCVLVAKNIVQTLSHVASPGDSLSTAAHAEK